MTRPEECADAVLSFLREVQTIGPANAGPT
jgi:hypothetical protein